MAVPGDVVDVQVCCQTPEIHGGPSSSVIVRRNRRCASSRSASISASAADASGRTCLTTNSSASSRSRSRDQLNTHRQESSCPRSARSGARGRRCSTATNWNSLSADRRWLTPEEIAAQDDAGAGTGPRLPYSGTVRQGARHPQMLAAARSVERDPAGSPRILHRPGLLVLRYPRASGTDAQPDRAHRVDGRGDGDRRVRGRRPRAHRRAG